MEIIDIQKEFGPTLDRIWKSRPVSCLGRNDIVDPRFAIEKSIPKGCDVLFIGMNPSSVKSQSQYYDPYKINIDYFERLRRFCKDIPLEFWGHHDIYPIRCTDQKQLIKVRKYCKKKGKTFFDSLQDLTKDIIQKVNPKLIVVLNAGASNIFREMYNINPFPSPSFDKKKGAEIIHINNRDVPVIFSGMLSGQRALDIGSRVSLQWHIDKVLHPISCVPSLPR